MRTLPYLLSATCVLTLFLRAPANAAAEPAPAGPPAQLAAGNNQFALDLYQQLAKKSDGPLFFSPYSVSTALAMAYAGAKGDTADQMAKTLHFTLPSEQLNAAFGDMLRKLTAADPDRGFQLHVANRLWGQQGFKFLPAFLQVTKDSYGAELGLVDFVNQTEAARTTINDWVAQQTNDKIKDLVPPGAAHRPNPAGADQRDLLQRPLAIAVPCDCHGQRSVPLVGPADRRRRFHAAEIVVRLLARRYAASAGDAV